MKHLKPAAICLVLALAAMMMTDARAGRVKKPPKGSRTEKTEEMKKPHRFENFPTMRFVSGELSRGTYSGWKVGETPLYLHHDCVVNMDGAADDFLVDGRHAVVMGVMVGEAINAWSVYIPRPDYLVNGMPEAKMLREPGPDPDVGRILRQID